MAKRLVKVAKELNVGTQTIVEHLIESGFHIENKPTAKITDEMEAELLKEFQKSIAIKEKADQLVIGTRPVKKEPTIEKTEPVTITPSPKPIPTPPPVVEEPVAKEVPPVVVEQPKEEKPQVAPPSKPIAEESPAQPETKPEEVSTPKIQLKLKGKIDLDKNTRKSKPKKTEKPAPPKEEAVVSKPEPKKEAPVPAEAKEEKPSKVDAPAPASTAKEKKPKEPAPAPEAKKEEIKPKKEEVKAETPAKKDAPKKDAETSGGKPKDDEMMRAATPELRGLKILGKINIEKKPKKKKEKKAVKGNEDSNRRPGDKKPVASSDKKPNSDGERRRRPRTRRRVQASSVSNNQQNRQGGSSSGGRSGGGVRGRGGNRPTRGNSGNRGRRREDEVKEVSQKEIDDKIRATMARISGSGKKKRQRLARDKRERLREKAEQIEAEKVTEKLQLTEFISVQELANLMDVPATDVIMACMNLGVIVSINQRLDAEVIELVATEFDHEVEFITAEEQADDEVEIVDDPEDLVPRSPIVTVMGHVDHGKTSLLDYIREANVVDGEAGGITQHIGAYEVNVKTDEGTKRVTFLDTPGHEAFTAMRARGAKVTDIAIIIIAADDSIMPQTREAISHAQAAGVPMVFAINKIDKPGAKPERIKQELASMNLLIEEWGGEYQSQDLSAKTGEGIEELLEKLILVAELLELKANPERMAVGAILEASLDKGRGYVTKALVQTGTLHIGDAIVAGEYSGKIKAMFNERGKRVKSAGPSAPVLVLGLNGAPQAGERFKETEDESEARQLAAKRAQISREQSNRATKRISLDEIGRRLALGTFKELNLIVKGDVDGSIEALSDSLIKLSQETVQVNVIHKAVGQIIESDVLLASASDAIILGFQVRPSSGARKLAEREGVQIKGYSIIYEAIDEIKAAIEGMLEPTKEEKIVCNVEVREVYKISKIGTVAGCYVTEGKITRNTNVRLIRNGIVVYPTKEGAIAELASLKRFKEDAKEVKNGMECGITIKNFNDIKVGDVIEGYEIIEIKQKLQL
jgi:translation initiation factor IF-2